MIAKVVSAAFLMAAIITGAAGYRALTPATQGVGLIGIACLLGIVARVILAGAEDEEEEQR